MMLVGWNLWLIGTPRAMSADAAEPAAPPLPPLVIDKSAPLLLDSPSATEGHVAQPQTTLNAACFVCHENYARRNWRTSMPRKRSVVSSVMGSRLRIATTRTTRHRPT